MRESGELASDVSGAAMGKWPVSNERNHGGDDMHIPDEGVSGCVCCVAGDGVCVSSRPRGGGGVVWFVGVGSPR